MTDTDDTIAAALSQDDRAFLETLDDHRGMFRQIGDSWSGPLGGWARFSFALAVVIGIALAYTFYRAVTAEALQPMVGWGMSTLGLLIMQGFLKEWMFARLNMIAVLREVKRLQVQVALLAEK